MRENRMHGSMGGGWRRGLGYRASRLPYSAAPEQRRLELGAIVRRHRHSAGLDQTKLADRVGIGQASLSKIEVGRTTPTAETLARLTDALALSDEDRAELLDLLALLQTEIRTLRVMQRRGGHRAVQASIGEVEAAARTISAYQIALVPGLLQTAEYARSMLAVLAPHIADVDGLVAGRLQRQQILYDPTRRFRFLMTEGALRARVAPSRVLRGQLDRIIAMATGFEHIDIGVLPANARLTACSITSFDLLGEVVTVELPGAEVTIRDPQDVARYAETFEGLWRPALRGQDLVPFLRALDRELAQPD